MPRPSDVYATLGAPGVYQATPWIPCQLPNVYVFPPEEDNQDVFCLFHSGSASPTAFESFYRNPVYSQRDPNSPTFTDLTALDHALSYFQRQPGRGNSALTYGRRPSWENGERIGTQPRNYSSSTASSASSRSSSESARVPLITGMETSRYSYVRYLVDGERQLEEQRQDSHYVPSRPASRRSSVFGDRPPDYEAFETRVREEDRPGLKKSQTMTLKSRAAVALKAFGSARARRTADDHTLPDGIRAVGTGPTTYDSWFELEHSHKKRNRRMLAQLFSSNSNVDATAAATDGNQDTLSTRPLSPVRDLKLNRRKSMTQLFSITRSSMESATKADNPHPRPDMNQQTAALTPSSLVSHVHEPKLSKRKSMSQLFRLGRSASSTPSFDNSRTTVGIDDMSMELAYGTPSRGSLPTPAPGVPPTAPVVRHSMSSGAAFSQPLISEPHTPHAMSLGATSDGRKSFLNRRSFSFLDLHRHFISDSAPSPPSQAQHTQPTTLATPSTVHNSPDSLSERTDSSSSVLASSTDGEQTGEDDLQFLGSRIGVRIPAVVRQSNEALAKDIVPKILLSEQLDLNEDINFSSRFGLHTPEDDAESETYEEPTLELAVRLDSLSFDQLVFDPDSFAGATYD